MAPALDFGTKWPYNLIVGIPVFLNVSWANQETEPSFSPAVLISSHARCSFFRSSATFVRLSGNITCPKKGRREGRGRFNPLAPSLSYLSKYGLISSGLLYLALVLIP